MTDFKDNSRIIKICNLCKEKKLLDCFYKHKHNPDGFTYSCKECIKIRVNKWYYNNLESTKYQRKQYREKNKTKIKKNKQEYYKHNKKRIKLKVFNYYNSNHAIILNKSREYYNKNRETSLASRRQWNIDNPERRREQRWLYKVRKKKQLGFLPKKYIDLLWYNQKGLCYYCQCNLEISGKHIEHMLPLSRGGLHDISNICLSCPNCNLSKGTKTDKEFLISHRDQ